MTDVIAAGAGTAGALAALAWWISRHRPRPATIVVPVQRPRHRR